MKKRFVLPLVVASCFLLTGVVSCAADNKTSSSITDNFAIDTVTIDEAGDLIFTLKNGTTINAGNVKGAQGTNGTDGVGVVNASLDATGKLVLTLSNGNSITVGNVVGTPGEQGKDGVGIREINVSAEGHLVVSFTNGTQQDLGKITADAGTPGTAGRGISSVSIDKDGKLVVSYTDGTSETLGVVKGDKGDKGDNGDKGDKGDDGVGVKTATVNDKGELIITLTNGSVINVGKVTGNDGTTGKDGIDGKSAYELYVESHPDYEDHGEEAWLSDLVNGLLSEKTKYSVTFTVDGEAYGKEQNVEFGHPVSRPEKPVKEGYTFLYWEDPDGMPWSFYGNVVTSDLTLNAVFEVNTYEVTIINGENAYSSSAEYGSPLSSIGLPNPDSYNGHDFAGWYLDDEKVSDDYIVTNDLTLIASYKDLATVEIDYGEGKTVRGFVETKSPLSSLNETIEVPTRNGYTLVGYQLVDESDLSDESVLSTTSINKVKAIWEFTPIYSGEYKSDEDSSIKLTVSKDNVEFVRGSYTYTGKLVINDGVVSADCVSTSGDKEEHLVLNQDVKGVVSVVATGNTSYQAYFYTSDVTFINYRVNYVNSNYHVFFNTDGSIEVAYKQPNGSSIGKKVEAKVESDGIKPNEKGAIITFSNDEITETVKVKGVTSYTGNIQVAVNRGTYTNGDSSLTLDGFALYSTSRGVASIDGTTYDYYFLDDTTVAICNSGSSTLVKYLVVDVENKTFADPTELKDCSIAETKVKNITYSSLGSYYFDLDKYGIGKFYDTSKIYYGRLVKTEDGYTFTGYTDNSSRYTKSLAINDLGDAYVSVSDGSTVTYYAKDGSTVSYVGYSYSNLFIEVKNDAVYKYFYASGTSATLSEAKVEFSNGTCFAKDAIFSITSGSVNYPEVKIVTIGNREKGYVVPNELKGTYILEGKEDLVLDGFSSVKDKTTGVAKLGSKTGTYVVYIDDIIAVTIDDVTTKYDLDLDSHTYSLLEEVDTGVFAGTYTSLSTSSSKYTLTINKDGTVDILMGSTKYGGKLTLTETGYSIEAIYSGSSSKSTFTGITVESDGSVITFIDRSYKYYFVKGATSTSFIGAESSSKNLLFKVEFENSTKYYYQETTNSVLDHAVTATLGQDSPSDVALGDVKSIIEVKDGDEVLFVAKVKTKSSTSGFTLANVETRLELTSVDGKTLFLDGFATSDEKTTGYAYLDSVKYSYVISREVNGLVKLYTVDTTTLAKYVTYDSTSYEIVEAIFEDDDAMLNKFSGTNSTGYYIQVDKYGYGKIHISNDYFGKFTFNEDKTTFTFEGNYYNSYNNKLVAITSNGTIYGDGIIFVANSGNDSTCQYYTYGKSKQYGKEWKNFLYVITVGDTEKYYFAKDRYSNLDDYVGEVKVDVISGTGVAIGSVVRVTSLDGETIYIEGCKLVSVHGNNGYELADAYYNKSFVYEETTTIKLDGFGTATIGEESGTYTISGTKVTVVVGNDVYIIDGDSITKVAADILIGKSFKGSFSSGYGWDSEDYTVTFTFDGLGGVMIKYSSNGYGSPSYASTKGKAATYVLDGNTITVTSGSVVFTFTLDSATEPTVMTCATTTLSSSSDGYFSKGQKFNIA